ncbi:HET-domain-containing protein [Hypoxylon sp. NC1633]|nr:HET-domain-containing protein [Hypoxylon sp. NC1633]
MADIEGILCATCRSAFGTPSSHSFMRIHSAHHQRYCDLVASRELGCFICTWIFSRHPPQPTRGNSTGDTGERFSIDCTIHFDPGCLAIFVVECTWAADHEISVRLCSCNEHRTNFYPRTSLSVYRSDILARPWSRLDPYIGSSQSLQTILSWISTCKNHERCQISSNVGSYFPTRAIDLQEASSGIVHLRNRDEAISQYCTEEQSLCDDDTPYVQKHPEYWTLSHRWGDPSRVTQLKKETEHQLRGGISLGSLTATFRDAALLVHRLGYRYLWIDSLCIFQDSESEWQQEASSMIDVYSHSFCNISAISSSNNPSLGLFGRRMVDARSLYPFITNVGIRTRYPSKPDHGPWIAWNDSMWTHEIENAPLHSRGWVVQERFLAKRAVHVTSNQIYWECLECAHCEADTTLGLIKSLGHDFDPEYKAAKIVLHPAKRLSFHRRDYILFWLAILSRYASCNLTKESDTLIALSGIAKAFREVNGDAYLAGLWKGEICYGFLWETTARRGTRVHRNESYAPSWSWASVVATERQRAVTIYAFKPLDRPTPLIRLLDERIVTDPPGGDTTGLLRSAELDVECKFSYFRWAEGGISLEVYTDEAKTHCYGRFMPQSSEVSFDMSDRMTKFAKAEAIEGTCIPIIKADYLWYRSLYWLILELVAGNRFQRIGILQCKISRDLRSYSSGSNDPEAWWDDWDIRKWAGLSVITLV